MSVLLHWHYVESLKMSSLCRSLEVTLSTAVVDSIKEKLDFISDFLSVKHPLILLAKSNTLLTGSHVPELQTLPGRCRDPLGGLVSDG